MTINPATLTDWILTADHPPQHIGEYLASSLKSPYILRWWDGEGWSQPYTESFSDISKQNLRRKKTGVIDSAIYYRGLRAKPRVYSIHYLRPLK